LCRVCLAGGELAALFEAMVFAWGRNCSDEVLSLTSLKLSTIKKKKIAWKIVIVAGALWVSRYLLCIVNEDDLQ
jgi:hypothetical protein